MAGISEKITESNEEDPWNDTLLIKTYDDSIKLAREELAHRIALSTNNAKGTALLKDNKTSNDATDNSSQCVYKTGDYVRATYEDGIDYEAKILSIDEDAGTCVLKYIGYENEQEVPLSDLIASWGKKARRLQFAKAKVMAETDKNGVESGDKTSKRNKTSAKINTIPPPPPMPPMLSATQNTEDAEHLSAMLMSWYMSGYYTGVYQGIQMGKSASKGRKQ